LASASCFAFNKDALGVAANALEVASHDPKRNAANQRYFNFIMFSRLLLPSAKDCLCLSMRLEKS
jgi:hypothetical protein